MLYPNGYQPAEHRRALNAIMQAMAAPPSPPADAADKPQTSPPASRVLQERCAGGECTVTVTIAPTAPATGGLKLA